MLAPQPVRLHRVEVQRISAFFVSSHPGLLNLVQLFLVPVAAQACNKLSSNELEPPVLGDHLFLLGLRALGDQVFHNRV